MDMETNTAKGRLDISGLHKTIIAPCVFSGGWVSRKLTNKERYLVWDFPSSQTEVMTEPECVKLMKNTIPGKVLHGILWFLTQEDNTKPEANEGEDEGLEGNEYQQLDGWIGEDNEEKLVRLKEELDGVAEKAVKADNSEVPVSLWNKRVQSKLANLDNSAKTLFKNRDLTTRKEQENLFHLLDQLRLPTLQYWKRKVRLDFMRWYNCNRESWEDKHAEDVLKSGLKAVSKVNGASFWEWDKGSSLFFWRFPPHYQETARTGIAPMFDSNPPQNNYRQEPIKDVNIKEKVREKVKKVYSKVTSS